MEDMRADYESKLQELNLTHEVIMDKLYQAMEAEEHDKSSFHEQHCSVQTSSW